MLWVPVVLPLSTRISGPGRAALMASQPSMRTWCVLPAASLLLGHKLRGDLTSLLQGKYILTPSPITYGEEQLLHFLGQLLGIAIRADVPLPLDLLPSFWKTLVGEPLDPDQDLQEADILTYNYVKKFESVSEGIVFEVSRPQGHLGQHSMRTQASRKRAWDPPQKACLRGAEPLPSYVTDKNRCCCHPMGCLYHVHNQVYNTIGTFQAAQREGMCMYVWVSLSS